MRLPRYLYRPDRPARHPLVGVAAAAALLLAGGVWLAAQPRPTSAPFLWKAERAGGPPLWLYGTIHVPDARVQSLPPAVAAAFAGATHVVTEIPLDLQAQLSVTQQLLLPADQRLRDIVGEARFARLAEVIATALADEAPAVSGIVVAALDRLKPWAAMAQLSLVEYLPDVLSGRPSLDARLYDDAKQAGKRLSALETVEEQAGVFDAFTTAEQVALLDAALVQAESASANGPSPGRVLVDRYLRGDADELVEAMQDQGPSDASLARKFERVLLRDRNHRMIERLVRLRADHPDDLFFVAVGTLHLVGPASLPALLEQHGYRVERVSSTTAP